MAGLGYVGRNPDSDSTVVPKSYADSQESVLAVTTGIVNTIINQGALALTTKSYVDQQDATRAHKTDVTAADANYVALSALGQPSGVASLDSSGALISSQIPSSGLLTDRVFACYSVVNTGTAPLLGGVASSVQGAVGTINLAPGASHTVNTTTIREYQLASIIVPDPGFPWRPIPLAFVQGNSAQGAAASSRQVGNGNFGLLSVVPPSGVSDTVYGVGVCTGSLYTDTYMVFPHAGTQTPIPTPTVIPPITGGLELDLFGSVFSGTTYTFFGTNLQYYVLVVPAV